MLKELWNKRDAIRLVKEFQLFSIKFNLESALELFLSASFVARLAFAISRQTSDSLMSTLHSTVGQNQINVFGNCFLLKNAREYPLIVIFLHFFPFFLFLMLFNFLFTLGLFFTINKLELVQNCYILFRRQLPLAVAFCVRASL